MAFLFLEVSAVEYICDYKKLIKVCQQKKDINQQDDVKKFVPLGVKRMDPKCKKSITDCVSKRKLILEEGN